MNAKRGSEVPGDSNLAYDSKRSAMFQISVLFPTVSSTLNKNMLGNPPPPMFPNSANCGTENSRLARTSPYFASILNLASVFGFIPFKLEMEDGEYKMKQLGILRKLFCGLIHVLAVGMFIYYNLRLVILASNSAALFENIAETFDIVANSGTVILLVLFLHTFWRRQPEILAIVEGTRVHYEGQWLGKHQAVGILMFLVGYTGCFYINYEMSRSDSYYNCWVSKQEGLHWRVLFNLSRFLLYHAMSIATFTHTCLVMVALGMKFMEGEFSSNLEATLKTQDIKKGLQYYMGMKHLLANITRTFGSSLLTYYIISVAYFAKIPEAAVWQQSAEATSLFLFFGVGSVIWLVSAEFHMNIRDAVQNWAALMQDLDDLTIDTRIKLLSIVNDNLLDPIGISCKFFTVTYGFLGSMLGLIVTYAIIVFQMQAKPQNWTSPSVTVPPPIIKEISKLYTRMLVRTSVDDGDEDGIEPTQATLFA